jgi:hypothetical protein
MHGYKLCFQYWMVVVAVFSVEDGCGVKSVHEFHEYKLALFKLRAFAVDNINDTQVVGACRAAPTLKYLVAKGGDPKAVAKDGTGVIDKVIVPSNPSGTPLSGWCLFCAWVMSTNTAMIPVSTGSSAQGVCVPCKVPRLTGNNGE